MTNDAEPRLDRFSKLMGRLMESPMPAVLVFVVLGAGLVALWITPREEDPQIVVPAADVIISAPGLSAKQVERQVATPLEKLLFQIDGVEYVYSMSQPGRCVVTVRFFVGEDREDSLVKIYNKVQSNTDRVPAAVESWIVKPVEIDDVPIVVAAIWSENPKQIGVHELRRLAEEIEHKLQSIPHTNRVYLTGGPPRRIRVELNPEALAARRTSLLDVAWAIGVSNDKRKAGEIQRTDSAFIVEAGTFIRDVAALRDLVINVVDGVPVYLKDIAEVIDGPAEPSGYTWLGFGPADGSPERLGGIYPAVFVAVAKQKGANAVWVARDVEHYLTKLKHELFPPGVHFRVIRNYGDTADEKVNDLVASLGVAVLTVIVFIGLFLGWRAALVVGFAIPICYSTTLALDYFTGYTINRVTLFALILALGLLVDDPITGVDNIERYFRLARHDRKRSMLIAVAEIRSPLVMSTLAIIIAFVPLSFITGMMGPYMAPMAFNVPVTVTVSTLVAFFITPWMAYRIMRHDPPVVAYDIKRTLLYRAYGFCIRPLIRTRWQAHVFLLAVLTTFIVAVALPGLRSVPLKLLPHDNKNEFQIVVDMPEGTTLERTQAVTRTLGQALLDVPEVEAIAAFVGVPSPIDFNGMLRHYYFREGLHYADLRVTLLGRRHRRHQSHEILLRIRKDLERIAVAHGARIRLVEVPPGPPVVSTIAIELYGEEATPYAELQTAARELAKRLEREPFVTDVDTSVEDDQAKLVFVADKEKAALSGVSTEEIVETLVLATSGEVAGFLQIPTESNPLPIELRLPIERRSAASELATLYVKGMAGIAKVRDKGGIRDAPQPLVQLGELGAFEQTAEDSTIYHKNLKRVAYIFGESAGRPPADAVLDIAADQGRNINRLGARPLAERTHLRPGGGDGWQLPAGIRPVWTGEGEWDITVRVFRDLGIAFAVALVGIFVLLWVQTGLAAVTLIIMLAIPLTVVGIMPGFWLLNQIGERTIEGYPNPVLFTATAMIGMIALAGIVVRNSLVLIEFVHSALGDGLDLEEALVQAGTIRMRPIFLTAGTTLLGNLVITLDPIFNGLAWAIIFGIVASTVFTLAVIPVVYYLVYAGRPGHGLPVVRSSEA